VERPASLSIVIPCHNEEASLTGMSAELARVWSNLGASGTHLELVLVDDGSTDATWDRMNEIAMGMTGVTVRLVRHSANRGLGAALRTGFAAAHGSVIVTTDSDSTYPFSEIPALIACLTDDVDIVTASPYHPDGAVLNVPRYRIVLSRTASWLYRGLVDPRIHTYTSMFRAYRAHVLRDVPFEDSGFLAVAELLVHAVQRGFRVVEYPTRLHSRIHGVSKARLARTTVAHLRFMTGLALTRLRRNPSHPRRAVPTSR
jgi:dolichol-phosphate mannosyltransferase